MDVAPCGLNCTLCPVYLSTVKNTRIKGDLEWLGVIGEDKCFGCRTKNGIKVNCEIYLCCVKKNGLKFCYECKNYPCKLLPQASENTPSIKRWLLYEVRNSLP
ncbi:MAG: DUF3795 domain-containing protein [Candidatus Bathyarchaeota archaeon]